ncbi:hypothetical protein CMI37_22150 [Candidatus Pacearchaeota archaeon]|nr:hypothetical protein [Candidatus Pacearchaeota archaeon]|tara:strand:- start:9926 stop:11908 length:1983 start_codon:yes stop_codon:yes gene_type:complete
MNDIFINIAGYRDKELVPTVRDAIEKAKDKSRISFGICWQYGPDEPKDMGENEDELFDGIAGLNYSRYDYRDSLGMGWARKISQSFYKGEKFQLQIDSHMRFAQDWDWHLLNLHERCKRTYNSKNPIVTSRTLPYYPEKSGEVKKGLSTYMHPSKFRDNGVLIITSGGMRKRHNFRECIPSCLISGHYMFSAGKIIEEMPYDDKFAIISTGDEPILAAKAWTRGWDIFQPHKVYIWHHFYREGAHKNHNNHKGQDDHKNWKKMADEGVQQFNDIINGKIKAGTRYGLGTKRTLDDYRDWCGVDYRKKTIDPKLVFIEDVFHKEQMATPPNEKKREAKKTSSNKTKQSSGEDKIFIQIASYRDKDIYHTIKNCMDQSHDPSKLIFGIFDQYGPENSHLEFYDRDNFRVIRAPFYASSGLGYARHMIQKLYFDGDAEYTMQLDSHMRFSRGWDTKLKEMLHKTGAKKPIISHYCTPFTFSQKKREYLDRSDLFKMYCLRFNPGGTISFRQHRVKDQDKTGVPGKSMWVSGHFYFTLASHIKEYPYDPNLYFAGDEISLAVRSWTNGWDIFYPSENVVYHNYTREDRICHWSDQKRSYSGLHEQSHKALRELLGMEKPTRDFGPYGLGRERSLSEYEKAAGIDFKKRILHEAAKLGDPILSPA